MNTADNRDLSYDERKALKRKLFFEALGIEDDGRREPYMTRKEFEAFDKPIVDSRKFDAIDLRGKKMIEIYFTFEAYYDVGYDYCFDDDTVYEKRLYVGD